MICEQCRKDIQATTCSRCGASLLKLGRFCYHCGNDLEIRPHTAETEAEETDFSSRILCSDGNCIGVINEQGICKICGKPYTPED